MARANGGTDAAKPLEANKAGTEMARASGDAGAAKARGAKSTGTEMGRASGGAGAVKARGAKSTGTEMGRANGDAGGRADTKWATSVASSPEPMIRREGARRPTSKVQATAVAAKFPQPARRRAIAPLHRARTHRQPPAAKNTRRPVGKSNRKAPRSLKRRTLKRRTLKRRSLKRPNWAKPRVSRCCRRFGPLARPEGSLTALQVIGNPAHSGIFRIKRPQSARSLSNPAQSNEAPGKVLASPGGRIRSRRRSHA